jgi:hypothetical protein
VSFVALAYQYGIGRDWLGSGSAEGGMRRAEEVSSRRKKPERERRPGMLPLS